MTWLACNEWTLYDKIIRIVVAGMTAGSSVSPTVSGWMNSGASDGTRYGWFGEVIYSGTSKAHKIDLIDGTAVASYSLPSSNWTVQAKPLMDAAAGYVYFVGYDDQTTFNWHVNRVRLSDGDVTTLQLTDADVWNDSGPEGATIDTANGFLYVNAYKTSATTGNAIWKIDLSDFTIDSTHVISGDYKTFGPGEIRGGYLYIPGFKQVGAAFYPSVLKITIADWTEAGLQLNGGAVSLVARSLAIDAGGNFAYVTTDAQGAEKGRLYKVDLSDFTVDSYIEYANSTHARGVAIDDTYVYVAVGNFNNGAHWGASQVALSSFTESDSVTNAAWDTNAPWHIFIAPDTAAATRRLRQLYLP